MLEEPPSQALRSFLADPEVVWRVQIDKREGFDRALHVKAVAVDHLGCLSKFRSGPFATRGKIAQDLCREGTPDSTEGLLRSASS
jgi:hypothetical protein